MRTHGNPEEGLCSESPTAGGGGGGLVLVNIQEYQQKIETIMGHCLLSEQTVLVVPLEPTACATSHAVLGSLQHPHVRSVHFSHNQNGYARALLSYLLLFRPECCCCGGVATFNNHVHAVSDCVHHPV